MALLQEALEAENAEKSKKQESIIKDITEENQTLKLENEKLLSIINSYMKNFECFSGQKSESLEKGEIHSAIEKEKCISVYLAYRLFLMVIGVDSKSRQFRTREN